LGANTENLGIPGNIYFKIGGFKIFANFYN